MDINKVKDLQALGFTNEQIVSMLKTDAPASPVNTIASTFGAKPSSKQFDSSMHRIMNNDKFKSEETVPVTVAVPYGKQVGGVIQLAINGIQLLIPCDGETYKVPKSFAEALKVRLRNLDALESPAGPQFDGLSDSLGKAQLKPANVKVNTVNNF